RKQRAEVEGETVPLAHESSSVQTPNVGRARVSVKWCEASVSALFRLRYHDMLARFDGIKNNQAKREAWELLAAELSIELQRPFNSQHAQNKINELKKLWFAPSSKATGNGRRVRTRPQYYDVMFEYWGDKAGFSRTSFMTTDGDLPAEFLSSPLACPEGHLDAPSEAESTPLSSDSCDENVSELPQTPVSVDTPKLTKRLFSRSKAKRSPTGKPLSQAESLFKGLEAVGNGLHALGSAVVGKRGTMDGDVGQQILGAIEKQTSALEQQNNQLSQLLQHLLGRGSASNP
ncbi:hypothetical protein DYB32_010684, partial [Aphanomyces invadans]